MNVKVALVSGQRGVAVVVIAMRRCICIEQNIHNPPLLQNPGIHAVLYLVSFRPFFGWLLGFFAT